MFERYFKEQSLKPATILKIGLFPFLNTLSLPELQEVAKFMIVESAIFQADLEKADEEEEINVDLESM